MSDQLKQIEDKLDIIIAAMSANPDFEKYVKEGMLNKKLEDKRKELEIKNAKISDARIQKAFTIYTGHNFISQFDSYDLHAEFEKYKLRIDNDFIGLLVESATNREYFPILYEEVSKSIEEPIDIDAELEKIKQEYKSSK